MRGETIMLPPDTFGPCATVVTERRPSSSRGFDAEATASAGNVAVGVDPALPVDAAGLRNGMKILARTEGEPDNALAPYALRGEDRGLQRTIRYLPHGPRASHGPTGQAWCYGCAGVPRYAWRDRRRRE